MPAPAAVVESAVLHSPSVIVVDGNHFTLPIRCGKCGQLAAQIRGPVIPPPSAWAFEWRTLAKQAAKLIVRKLPALEPVRAAFFDDDNVIAGYAALGGLYSAAGQLDTIRCRDCAEVPAVRS